MVAVAASFAWSVYDTEAHPTSAYFSTLTRAWELGLGAALAVGAAWLAREGRRIPPIVGWAGAAAIVAAAFAYSHATAFPGYAALVPTLGTVLVIGAGLEQTSSRFSVGRVLSLKPFRYIGDRSYALYLWHWPFLILGALYVGHALGLLTRLLLVFASFLVAILTYRFFENPIRHMRSRPLSALLWPASIGAVVLVAALALGSISTAADRFQASGTPAQPVGLRHTPSGGRSLAAQGVSGGSLPEVISTVEAARRGAGIPGASFRGSTSSAPLTTRTRRDASPVTARQARASAGSGDRRRRGRSRS